MITVAQFTKQVKSYLGNFSEKVTSEVKSYLGNFSEKATCGVSTRLMALNIAKSALQKIGKLPRGVSMCCNYCLPIVQGVGLSLHKDKSIFWSSRHQSHCKRVWLCPWCGRVIVRERATEIGRAFDSWRAQGGKVYMVTLTVKHSRDTSLVDVLPKMKKAYLSFRNTPRVQKFWAKNGVNLKFADKGSVSVISNWECTFGQSGSHLHRHILWFVKGDCSINEIEGLLSVWVRFVKKNGLDADLIAQNVIECTVKGDYVSKIGFEMTSSAVTKEGRGAQRFNYMDICQMVASANAPEWAIKALSDYVDAIEGVHALEWSKGLKGYFNVIEMDDEEILASDEERMLAYISGNAYRNLKPEQKESFILGCNVLASFLKDPPTEHEKRRGLVYGLEAVLLGMCIKYRFNVFKPSGELRYCGNKDTLEADRRAVCRQIEFDFVGISMKQQKEIM